MVTNFQIHKVGGRLRRQARPSVTTEIQRTFFKSCGTFFKTLPKIQKKSQELIAVFLILDIYFCPFFDFLKKMLFFLKRWIL
jgi:hypothetical protein